VREDGRKITFKVNSNFKKVVESLKKRKIICCLQEATY
jgi:hypothetical protein